MNDEQKVASLIENAPDMGEEFKKFYSAEKIAEANAAVEERVSNFVGTPLGDLLCSCFLEIFAPGFDLDGSLGPEVISELTLRADHTPREVSAINGLKADFDNLSKAMANYFAQAYVEAGFLDEEDLAAEIEAQTAEGDDKEQTEVDWDADCFAVVTPDVSN